MIDKSKETQLVARYDNDINTLAMGKLTPVEQDMFISLCALVKEKGTQEITLNFEKLKDILKYEPTSIDRFVKDLERTNRKLLSLNLTRRTDGKIVMFTVFMTFVIDPKEQTLRVRVHPEFEYLLTLLGDGGGFTRFELKEFVRLRSGYAKDLYRLLKQYRTVGAYNVPINDFRHLLDVPMSYKMKHIDEKILTPTLNELKVYFPGLKVTKIKSRRRGNPITHLEFTFKQETPPPPKDSHQMPDAAPKKRQKNKSSDLMNPSGDYKPIKK